MRRLQLVRYSGEWLLVVWRLQFLRHTRERMFVLQRRMFLVQRRLNSSRFERLLVVQRGHHTARSQRNEPTCGNGAGQSDTSRYSRRAGTGAHGRRAIDLCS
jgi:hypothetical protein